MHMEDTNFRATTSPNVHPPVAGSKKPAQITRSVEDQWRPKSLPKTNYRSNVGAVRIHGGRRKR
jgi:hypothetical protein